MVLRLPLGLLVVLSAVAVAALAVVFADQDSAGRFDRWTTEVVMWMFPDPGLGSDLIVGTCEPVPALVLVTLVGFLCLRAGGRQLGLVAVIGPATVGALTTLLKHLTGRLIHGSLSFPSGHTGVITAIGLSLGLLAAHRYGSGPMRTMLLFLAPAVLLGTTMALALVAADVHYPSDTIGGFLTALAVVPATALAVDRGWSRLSRSARAGAGQRPV